MLVLSFQQAIHTVLTVLTVFPHLRLYNLRYQNGVLLALCSPSHGRLHPGHSDEHDLQEHAVRRL